MTLPCLILGAGFGTRMRPLTDEMPKPLVRVADKTLLDHAIEAAKPAQPIAVNAHYRADQIADHLRGKDITVLHETPDILDSGGAVKAAAQRWPEGPMATLNADNVWTGAGAVEQLMAAFDPDRMGALLLLTEVTRAVGRTEGGDFNMDADGRLTLDKTHGRYAYTGAQILDPAPCLDEPRDIFSLRDTWAAYQAEGRLFGLIHQGQWADVGHPAGILLAEKMLDRADV